MSFELEERRAEIEQHAENSARLAEAFAKFDTQGQGSVEFNERVDFGLTFVEDPFVHYGAEIDLDALDDALGNEAGAMPPLPLCSGFVTKWDQDDRGFYVGCWTAVRVWFPYESNVSLNIGVPVKHHFTFKAVAIKDVPLDLRD